jgi:hypothetical protein
MLLEACSWGYAPSTGTTPRPTLPAVDDLPHIFPTPGEATYGELSEIRELVCRSFPTPRLAELLDEVASSAGLPVANGNELGPGAALIDLTLGPADLPAQGYLLEVGPAKDPGSDQLHIAVTGADEAGAYYGLLSLAQLITSSGTEHLVRSAAVRDSPGFARRGVILDAPLPVTAEGRAQLIERLRFGVGYKLNLVWPANAAFDDRRTASELIEYCTAHFIEVLVMLGYQDQLTQMPRKALTDLIRSYYDQGVRSFSFNWDDLHRSGDPTVLAAAHGAVLDDVARYMATLNEPVRLHVTLPPYGGVPGVNLRGVGDGGSGSGEAYLAAIRDHIPAAAEVFWTGDGGVYSSTVTLAGATAYRDAVGRPVALWDNDALYAGRGRHPIAGRSADLAGAVDTYLGNMTNASTWTADNGEFALSTILDYTWNPSAYDAGRAAAEAELRLAAR